MRKPVPLTSEAPGHAMMPDHRDASPRNAPHVRELNSRLLNLSTCAPDLSAHIEFYLQDNR